jgi:hypothetical protein
MATNPRSHTDEDKDYDDKQVYKTKKVVDSHGVKNCPSSSTDQPNNVSPLIISQFEREFKACLERRKQNEPQILNILFPIKTDNRYLEYLENTQSQQTGK